MKKIISFLLAVLLLSSLAFAETRITVTGTGNVYIPADTCVVSLGVTESDADALVAQSKVNEKIASITAALVESGIEDKNITTGQLYLYARYDYTGDIETVIGYNANCTVSIRTDDAESAGSVIDTAFLNGANTLNGVTFGAKDTSAAETECLKAAVSDAAGKAAVLAEAYGMQLGAPAEVSEGYSYASAMDDNDIFSAKSTAEEAPAAGESYTPTEVRSAMVCVSATVTVVYTAE